MRPIVSRKNNEFFLRECTICKESYGPQDYSKTKSIFYPDGFLPVCNHCLKQYLQDNNFSWQAIDRICQYADIPFVPAEWERLHELNGEDTFPVYSEVFLKQEYQGLGWDDYFKEFLRLQKEGVLQNQLPLLAEERKAKLIERWGANYDDEALTYLEQLYNGLLATQNVSGALQSDQAFKICKISYEIDCRIRAGQDFDKLLASYDKAVKLAEFTPKNAKNASEFDSTGEVIKYLEKLGWRASYYNDVTQDIVDETIKNSNAFSRRLYINEPGIGEEITKRIEALERADKLEKESSPIDEETYYGERDYGSYDEYENDGYSALIDGEFEAEVDGYDES